MKRRTLLASAAGSALALAGLESHAQAYPTKPIKLLNSSPPGSSFDTIARAACIEAEKKLGQAIVTDYRSGAGGTPAFVAAKNAPPDGYTLVVLSLSTIRQPIQQDVGYDGVKDFSWIASLAEINFGIVVPADSPFKTWKDLLAWSKANPDKVSYGCPSGLGNSAHLFGAEIAARENLNWLPVPYRASNDCMVALLGGQLTFAIDTLISIAPQERNGKVRLLALATSQRSKNWPDVPTTKELGYDVTIESPVGIGGPAGMPAPMVAQLQDAFKFASEQPSFLNVLEQGALRPWYMPAARFRDFAERAEREQKALMSKYGFAKKAA
ncbi:tripartite tricarboxylate transporter substrate binding protein [Variovorax sp. KK3]|nr:tripartite tricarboxylate transporter substrate binding protein [Variovorax sp. KK3]